MPQSVPEPVDVLHPLLGVRAPELAALLERADPPATRVLTAARRLAQRRRDEQRDLQARLDATSTADGLGLAPTLRPGPVHLSEGDLLRALLAEEPARISAPFGDDLVAEELVRLRSSARAALDGAPAPAHDDVLDPRWARRWALADERHGAGPITVAVLVASLGVEGCAWLDTLSEVYREGLVTRHEVGLRFLACCDDDVRRHPFTPVPPAYLDRGERLEALERAFEASGGRVLLVGPARSGRSALLRAWLEAGGHERPVVLDPHHAFTREPVRITEPTLVGMTSPLLSARTVHERLMEHGLSLDADLLIRSREEWLTQQAPALAPGGPLQAVLVVEPRERHALTRAIPALADFHEVFLEPPEPLEVAMIWLAHTMPDPTLGLEHVLSAVVRLGIDRMAAIHPWALDELVQPHALAHCFDREAAVRSLVDRVTRRLLQAHDQGKAELALLARRRLPVLGGEAGLRALVELDERLFGPRSER